MTSHDSKALAPMNQLDPTAAAWLADMHRAAEMARLCLDQAKLTVRAAWYMPNGVGGGDLGQAMNRPTAVVAGLHGKAAHDAEWAAQDTYRQVVGWYARSATLALESVLAGGTVTARELEQRTLHRLLPNGRPAREDDWWDGPHRPPIPKPDALVTGHEGIDREVRKAYEPLEAAYRAAGEVDAADEEFSERESGYVADWEASAVHDASTRAEPLWESLHRWAEAVAFAAEYGRSRARGHQSAKQEGGPKGE